MAENLTIVSVVSFIAAGGFLLLTVLFWFVFKIPFVIGELTGRNARKSIVQQRTSNESAEAKKNLMQQMEKASEIKKTQKTSALVEEVETSALAEEVETSALTDEMGTSALADVKTEEPLQYEEEEAITLLEEVIFIHTDEVIA